MTEQKRYPAGTEVTQIFRSTHSNVSVVVEFVLEEPCTEEELKQKIEKELDEVGWSTDFLEEAEFLPSAH